VRRRPPLPSCLSGCWRVHVVDRPLLLSTTRRRRTPTATNTITITSSGVQPEGRRGIGWQPGDIVNNDTPSARHGSDRIEHTDCPRSIPSGTASGQNRQTSNLNTVRVWRIPRSSERCRFSPARHDHDPVVPNRTVCRTASSERSPGVAGSSNRRGHETRGKASTPRLGSPGASREPQRLERAEVPYPVELARSIAKRGEY